MQVCMRYGLQDMNIQSMCERSLVKSAVWGRWPLYCLRERAIFGSLLKMSGLLVV